jgi:hypothetical protein
MLEDTELHRESLILPSQYFDLFHRNNDRSGEVRLLLAILQDAVNCLLGQGGGNARKREGLQYQALMWISGKWVAPLPFEDVCDALSIDSDCLRGSLFKLLRQKRDGGRVLPRIRKHVVGGPFRISPGRPRHSRPATGLPVAAA